MREQVRERGLMHRVEVVCQDYRDITGSAYDAVATIEMGEHVGDDEYRWRSKVGVNISRGSPQSSMTTPA